jgi:type IV pilus assembly protein PilA
MKNLKAKTQKGFSLVELMVVIAIIAILAAVAIPMYSNYTTRARVGSAITSVGGLKAEIGEILNTNDTIPTANANITRDPNVAYNNTGAISLSLTGTGEATADATTGPNFVRLTPTKGSGSITWACSASGFTASQVPSTCTIGSGAVTQMS